MIIREAEQRDVPQLLDMGKAFAEMANLGEIVEQSSVDTVLALFMTRESRAIVLVSEDDKGITGSLAGFLHKHILDVSKTLATELWWWVEPRARGKGHHSALMDAFREWARRAGAYGFIMVSLAHMDIGKIYERAGMQKLETHYIEVF